MEQLYSKYTTSTLATITTRTVTDGWHEHGVNCGSGAGSALVKETAGW